VPSHGDLIESGRPGGRDQGLVGHPRRV